MSTDNRKTFNNALKNFTFDMASRGAIRHLFDLGLTAGEIHDELTFPTPVEAIRNELWNYLTESKIILAEKPVSEDAGLRYEFIKETNEYGKQSFRRVAVGGPSASENGHAKHNCSANNSYIPVDFGREKYKDPDAYKNKLSLLKKEDKAYVEDLPWPLQTVWHIKNDRILRILDTWKTFDP